MSNPSLSPQTSAGDRKIAPSRKIEPQKPDSAVVTARPLAHTSSRLIALSHYKQILTTFQVVADALTIVLSFLAGYYLWSVIGPMVAIDLYEPESIFRYYSFLGVTLITTLVGMEVHGLYQP